MNFLLEVYCNFCKMLEGKSTLQVFLGGKRTLQVEERIMLLLTKYISHNNQHIISRILFNDYLKVRLYIYAREKELIVDIRAMWD